MDAQVCKYEVPMKIVSNVINTDVKEQRRVLYV